MSALFTRWRFARRGRLAAVIRRNLRGNAMKRPRVGSAARKAARTIAVATALFGLPLNAAFGQFHGSNIPDVARQPGTGIGTLPPPTRTSTPVQLPKTEPPVAVGTAGGARTRAPAAPLGQDATPATETAQAAQLAAGWRLTRQNDLARLPIVVKINRSAPP